MSLLREIQNAAIEGSSDLETLLRKCRVLAARLQNEELKNWVQSELDGYRNIDVPDYRHFNLQAYGHFDGYNGLQLKNAQIPSICIPKDLREQLTSTNMRDGVSALIDMTTNCEEGIMKIHWPADAYPLFGDRIYEGMNLIQAWVYMPKSAVVGILSTIRNRILNFALEIEATNPNAGEAAPDKRPIAKEKVAQIFNNYIYGNVGSVASGQNIQQNTQQNINAGDFESLAKFLKEFGFNEDDLSELNEAVQTEPKADKNKFGPKVANWITKAVGKVAEGGMKISTSVASNVLSEAIKKYYGL